MPAAIKDRDVLAIVSLRRQPMRFYFMGCRDRNNGKFAAVQMNADLGLGSAAYGLSADPFHRRLFHFRRSQQHSTAPNGRP